MVTVDDGTRRPRRLVGVVVVFVGLLATTCAQHSNPETAGNRKIEFFVNMQNGDYDRAYSWLCRSTASSTTHDQFVTSEGQVLTPGFHPRSDGLEGGSYEQVPDPDTQKSEVSATTVEVITKTAGMPTTWRIDMRKEDGEWRLCSFMKAGVGANGSNPTR